MLALILCVVELGLAFLRIWHGAKTTWHNIVRYVAIAFSFIVFVLALGHFGKMHSLLAAQYDALRSHTYFSTSFSGSFYSMIKLRSAIDILIFVASVALTAFTGLVFAMSSKTAGQSMRKVRAVPSTLQICSVPYGALLELHTNCIGSSRHASFLLSAFSS